MVHSGKNGKAIREANHMEECLNAIKQESSLNNIEVKVKMSSALSTRDKASRKRFDNLLRYSIM